MGSDSKTVHTVKFIAGDSLNIPTLKVLRANGSLYKGASAPSLDKEQALKIYQAMLYTRTLDERMVAAQRQGRLSFYLTCTGEEASCIGTAAGVQSQDMIMAQYREQGALRYRGFTTDQFMSQLLGNEHDLGKGRQMPVHYGSSKLNYMTVSSPLATQIPQAAGYAYGQKLSGIDACTLCYFGEGAASEGDFHAGLNIAAVLRAPVIFICRNNGYAISTPTDEQFSGDGIASRGVGYGIETIRVDGNDILAVLEATQAARAFVIEHKKPVLIETMSYRLGAHSTSDDPSGYRSREEEDVWRDKDPISRMKNWLVDQGWWSDAEDTVLLEDYRGRLLAALKKAEKCSAPPIHSMITDVYDRPTANLHDQYEQLLVHIRQHPQHYPKSAGSI